MRAFRVLTLLLAVLTGAAACKENGTGVEVREFSFTGLHTVSESQVRSVLATSQSSRLPWGDNAYFDREEFEADLHRIVNFLSDRGFPRARVRTYDVKLSDDQR